MPGAVAPGLKANIGLWWRRPTFHHLEVCGKMDGARSTSWWCAPLNYAHPVTPSSERARTPKRERCNRRCILMQTRAECINLCGQTFRASPQVLCVFCRPRMIWKRIAQSCNSLFAAPLAQVAHAWEKNCSPHNSNTSLWCPTWILLISSRDLCPLFSIKCICPCECWTGFWPSERRLILHRFIKKTFSVLLAKF